MLQIWPIFGGNRLIKFITTINPFCYKSWPSLTEIPKTIWLYREIYLLALLYGCTLGLSS